MPVRAFAAIASAMHSTVCLRAPPLRPCSGELRVCRSSQSPCGLVPLQRANSGASADEAPKKKGKKEPKADKADGKEAKTESKAKDLNLHAELKEKLAEYRK